MNKMQFFVISALAIVASFTGGFFVNFVLGEKAAFAQKEYKPQKVIEAEEIRLVDRDGKVRATLYSSYIDFPGRNKYTGTHFDIEGDGNHRIKLSARSTGSLFIMRGRTGSEAEEKLSNISLQTNGVLSDLSLTAGKIPKKHIKKDGIIHPDISICTNSYLKWTNITMADEYGYTRATIGSTSMTTESGADKKFPISSISLIGEKKSLSWSAP